MIINHITIYRIFQKRRVATQDQPLPAIDTRDGTEYSKSATESGISVYLTRNCVNLFTESMNGRSAIEMLRTPWVALAVAIAIATLIWVALSGTGDVTWILSITVFCISLWILRRFRLPTQD